MNNHAIPWRRPMTGRDPDEDARGSTPLELFVDLCFVVAVAAAAATLHHDLSRGDWTGLLTYAVVFFGIWWAWVTYSWFASAYDAGDVRFRIATFVVMTGVLVMAAGIPRAMGNHEDFRVLVAGYVLMRLAMVPMWLLAARDDPGRRFTSRRYAVGISVVQAAWVLRTWLFAHGWFGWVLFGLCVVAELLTPYFAERAGWSPWHRHHIAERYELFTIIVLGEVLLATSQAISGSLDAHGLTRSLAAVIVGGLLTVFGLWWLYFKIDLVDCLRYETAFAFGYGHYFVFAGVAAVGAALAAIVDLSEHTAHSSGRLLALVFAGSVACYLVTLGAIHTMGVHSASPLLAVVPMVALILALGAFAPAAWAVLGTGLVVAASVAFHNARYQP